VLVFLTGGNIPFDRFAAIVAGAPGLNQNALTENGATA
jgi:hypothetical protein